MTGRGRQDDVASARVLEKALTEVPAYAEWRALDPGAGRPLDERYRALPVVTKALMRRHGPAGYVLPGMDLQRALAGGDIEMVWTSGTTEERIQNVWYQEWWDQSERQSWALNAHAAGLGGHREAILSGALQTGTLCEHGTLSMEERTEGRFLYLNEKRSAEEWTLTLMDRMVAELAAYRPAVLEASPSLLARLARYVRSKGMRLSGPQLIVLTYENPSLLHRRAIAAAFDAPIASSYGSTEAGYVFMECEAGRLHQVCASCRVDFQPLRPEHGGPCIGRIFVTTYNNPWRVLLRFDIGDLARLSRSPCPCGRAEGLTLDSIEGRTDAITLDAEGRAVTPGAVDRALAQVEGLAEYQVTQRGAREFDVLAVPERAGDLSVTAGVSDALAGLYGREARLSVREVPSFLAEPSGKYRLVRSMVTVDRGGLFASG